MTFLQEEHLVSYAFCYAMYGANHTPPYTNDASLYLCVSHTCMRAPHAPDVCMNRMRWLWHMHACAAQYVYRCVECMHLHGNGCKLRCVLLVSAPGYAHRYTHPSPYTHCYSCPQVMLQLQIGFDACLLLVCKECELHTALVGCGICMHFFTILPSRHTRENIYVLLHSLVYAHAWLCSRDPQR